MAIYTNKQEHSSGWDPRKRFNIKCIPACKLQCSCLFVYMAILLGYHLMKCPVFFGLLPNSFGSLMDRYDIFIVSITFLVLFIQVKKKYLYPFHKSCCFVLYLFKNFFSQGRYSDGMHLNLLPNPWLGRRLTY